MESQVFPLHFTSSDWDGHRLKEMLSNANSDIEKYVVEEISQIVVND